MRAKGTFHYDFVLLELAEPIKFRMEARPLFLADPGDKEAWTITKPFISMLTIVCIKIACYFENVTLLKLGFDFEMLELDLKTLVWLFTSCAGQVLLLLFFFSG